MQTDSVWNLPADPELERINDEYRRAFPWGVGATVFAAILWLLLQMALPNGMDPVFSPVIFVIGGLGIFVTAMALGKFWISPIVTCSLDKQRGLATITQRGALRWPPERRQTFPLEKIHAVLLWKEHEGPVWLGLQVHNRKKLRLRSNTAPSIRGGAGDQILLRKMIEQVQQVGSGISAQNNPPKYSLDELAQEIGCFLGVPVMMDLGLGERWIQLAAQPAGVVEVTPLSCPRCGGSLPAIQPGQDYLHCTYCGVGLAIRPA